MQREHNTYPVLSEALRFIDSAQNSLCHQDHKTNSSVQYSVVTIGIGGGFAAQVQICRNCSVLISCRHTLYLYSIRQSNIYEVLCAGCFLVPTRCIGVDASLRCFELQRASAHSREALGLLRGTRVQARTARVDLFLSTHDQVSIGATSFNINFARIDIEPVSILSADATSFYSRAVLAFRTGRFNMMTK